MKTNLPGKTTTQFRALSDDQIKQIFNAALKLLEKPGMRIHSREAADILTKGGARVDGDMAFIPASLVKETLRTVPAGIELSDRNGKPAMSLESHCIYYGTGSDCPFIMDAKTGERRKFVKKDIEDAARVLDACPNMDFHMSLGLMSDVPTYSYDRHQAAAMLRNTTKPLVFTAMSREGLSDITEMYYLLRGGRDAFEASPGFVIYDEPTSPLTHSKAALEKLIFSAERRIPLIYTPAPQTGATGPVTLAGTLALATAEFLGGMVISQLKRPGAPLIMGGVITSMDMRTMVFTYGSPELLLMSAACTDIAHWMKVPMFSTAGCSDSKVLDEQAAAEAALSILAAGLSGANLIHDVGFLDSALIGSYEMIVLSDEIAGLVKHFLRGVRVDEEALAVDLIQRVGPGGNFLTEEHTARNLRKELWAPRLMDRTRFGPWKDAGSKRLGDRLKERVADILANHKVAPLPKAVDAGINKILAAADRNAGANQTSLV
jgi:trimethylamine--corrinoid protein Co-methyltransferase